MKRFVFFFLAVFTYYIAGMYRYPPLMILLVIELLLFAVMFFLSRYFRRRLSVEFLNHTGTVQRAARLPCHIRARNRGRLPVNRFRLQLQFGYWQEPGKTVQRLYGGAEAHGECSLEFSLSAPYCGLILLQIEQMAVYDYLSLFSAKKRMEDEMRIAVFPQEQALHIELPSFARNGRYPADEQPVRHSGDDHQEIRQLREYRVGDSARFIHWNQSAKTEQLWIKEYEKEADSCINLFLDTAVSHEIQVAELNAFYEVLSALVLGLLQNIAIIRVHWYEEKRKNFSSADIENAEQCRGMLLQFYQMDFRKADSVSEKSFPEKSLALESGFLKLNLNLEWYYNNVLLHRFSMTGFDEEITHSFFVV